MFVFCYLNSIYKSSDFYSSSVMKVSNTKILVWGIVTKVSIPFRYRYFCRPLRHTLHSRHSLLISRPSSPTSSHLPLPLSLHLIIVSSRIHIMLGIDVSLGYATQGEEVAGGGTHGAGARSCALRHAYLQCFLAWKPQSWRHLLRCDLLVTSSGKREYHAFAC